MHVCAHFVLERGVHTIQIHFVLERVQYKFHYVFLYIIQIHDVCVCGCACVCMKIIHLQNL
jgi:hypothetical protein